MANLERDGVERLMQHTKGFTVESPIVDKQHRIRCPYCKRFITFDEFTDEKKMKWHTWECKFCGSFCEHGHLTYDESSYNYNDSSKECYCGRS